MAENTEQEQPSGQQPDEPGDPLAEIKPVNAENPEEHQQDPADRVIPAAARIPEIGIAIHAWNQKQVDDPADQEQPERKKVNRARYGAAEIKPVRADEAENPQNITDDHAVGVVCTGHCFYRLAYNFIPSMLARITATKIKDGAIKA